MNLDIHQQNAVDDIHGVISVIAGPGAGKTRVLIERTSKILENDYTVNPNEILIISFTNKVRGEIKERLYKKNHVLSGVQVHTFHSFAIVNLRKYCDYIDLIKNFTILDTEGENIILEEIYKEMNLNKKDIKYREMISLIEKYNERQFSDIPDVILELMPTIIKKFDEKKLKKGYLSFDDLLILFNKLFETPAGQLIAKSFKYIMCDEAQDLNKIQFNLINLLQTNGVKNIMLVGDLDQAIYEWRGAKPELFSNFYKNSKQHTLIYNYRSTPNILTNTNKLISNNKKRVPISFETVNNSHINPIFKRFISNTDFYKYLGDEIKNQIKSGVKPDDIAILYRNNFLSREYEKILRLHNIPYVIYNGIEFYNRKEIKDALALLKIIYNPSDEISWVRVLSMLDGIGKAVISKIKAINTDSWFDKIYSYTLTLKETSKYYFELKDLLNIFEEIFNNNSNYEEMNYPYIVETLVEQLNLREEHWNDESFDERIENFKELMQTMNECYKDGKNLTEYIDDISLSINLDEVKPQDCIRLMSMHSSKGLEFDTVFILGGVNEIIPGKSNDLNSEDERRLMYVAMTRAKKHLYCLVSNVNYFSNNGMESSIRPSVFYKEADLL